VSPDHHAKSSTVAGPRVVKYLRASSNNAVSRSSAAGLATLDALLKDADQHARRFQPARATRAHLLDQLGRSEEAVAAYDSAIDLTHDTAERQYLQQRRDSANR